MNKNKTSCSVKKSKRTEETIRRLSDAMKKLLSQATYNSIDISLITKEAGISRKSFYYHFNSKDEFFLFIIDENISSLNKLTENTSGCETLLTVCRFFYSEKSFYQPILKPEKLTPAYIRICTRICPILEHSFEELFQISMSNECCIIAADSMLIAIVRWISSGNPIPPEDFLISHTKHSLAYSEEFMLYFGQTDTEMLYNFKNDSVIY